jgi:hypothetical protein
MRLRSARLNRADGPNESAMLSAADAATIASMSGDSRALQTADGDNLHFVSHPIGEQGRKYIDQPETSMACQTACLSFDETAGNLPDSVSLFGEVTYQRSSPALPRFIAHVAQANDGITHATSTRHRPVWPPYPFDAESATVQVQLNCSIIHCYLPTSCRGLTTERIAYVRLAG